MNHSAPARIRKGHGANALNMAPCVVIVKATAMIQAVLPCHSKQLRDKTLNMNFRKHVSFVSIDFTSVKSRAG